ncbi:MAG: hypothetical protein NC548_48360 [Lachnospiraceae bacterium]|nr:hypothetical protein [Lachnospiraceae bacterium]
MPIWNNIDGVWRPCWINYAKINGVWRTTESWAKINGVWRETHRYEITADDILGFRMVYVRSDDIRHPDHPDLGFNNEIPRTVVASGEHPGYMDLTPKGILFHYDRDRFKEEGTIVYKGKLYAVLLDEQLVDVCASLDPSASEDRIHTGIPEHDVAWVTQRMTNVDIQVDGYVRYEAEGYNFCGWNRFFSTEDFISRESYVDKDMKQDSLIVEDYQLYPPTVRPDKFYDSCIIGIAREIDQTENNMVGSHGSLSQDIHMISVNGQPKPFVVEVYG